MILYAPRVIRREEGRALTVYQDSLGYPTVGVGHRVVPVDRLFIGDEITEKRCRELFRRDVEKARNEAHHLSWTLGSQPPEVLHALICMVFQLGYHGVSRFKKMLAALQSHDYFLAQTEMLNSKWAQRDTPGRAVRLASVVAGLARWGPE